MPNKKCPACNSNNIHLLINIPSQLYSGNYFDSISIDLSSIDLKYFFCLDCDFIFYFGEIYKLDYTNSHRSSTNQLPKYINFLTKLIDSNKVKDNDFIINPLYSFLIV
jgi:hypothetical protein